MEHNLLARRERICFAHRDRYLSRGRSTPRRRVGSRPDTCVVLTMYGLFDELSDISTATRCVPHKLSEDKKAHWMETSGDVTTTWDQDKSILGNTVTGDETWRYHFDPESKRKSIEWRSPTSPPPKKEPPSRQCRSPSSTKMASSTRNLFLRVKTVNTEFYEQVLKRLPQLIRRVRPESHRTGKWTLLHDNAPAHCDIRVRQLLAQRGVPVQSVTVSWRLRTSFCFPFEERLADVAAIQ
ncbi:hypothetical protein PR048_019514 [Dryococelus australis]|uniref:Transposase n=1 Tax=Dryococelus australis TaxID=614101 RepID=A0ABQ9H3N8_9NEOP|nr:hypothetical protein PR048_019514 [Dryococelus australis]